MQADQIAVIVEARPTSCIARSAGRSRAPDLPRGVQISLIGVSGKDLGDLDRLVHVVLRAAAPAEAAAEVEAMDFALVERNAEDSDNAASDASRFCVGTQASARSAESFTVQFIVSSGACARNGVE